MRRYVEPTAESSPDKDLDQGVTFRVIGAEISAQQEGCLPGVCRGRLGRGVLERVQVSRARREGVHGRGYQTRGPAQFRRRRPVADRGSAHQAHRLFDDQLAPHQQARHDLRRFPGRHVPDALEVVSPAQLPKRHRQHAAWRGHGRAAGRVRQLRGAGGQGPSSRRRAHRDDACRDGQLADPERGRVDHAVCDLSALSRGHEDRLYATLHFWSRSR